MARVPSVVQTGHTLPPFARAVRKLAVTGRSCANCGSPRIRPSYRRNALDILLACLLLSPFRCRVCGLRFYRVWRRSLLSPPDSPVTPLLLMPVRRKILELDLIEAPSIQPEPVQAERTELQVIPTGRETEVRAKPSLASPAPQPEEKPADLREFPVLPLVAAPPGRILILESDLSIRKLLRRLLERRGYATVEISHIDDLDTELRERGADLVVVDIAAMGPTGVKDVVAFANAHPSLKILALSAEAFKDSEIPGRLLALHKPFPLDSFVDCVNRLLGRSSSPNIGP